MKFLYDKANRKYLFILFGAILTICFVLIYILNLLYPLHPDDWEYTFVYSFLSDSPQRITGVGDIIESQYGHYFIWGGRVVVHSIAHVLLMLGKDYSNVINTIGYLLFVFLIYKYVNKGNKINPILYLLIFMMLWLYIPAFCSVVLWVTGGANYLWGTLIIFLFMYPFYTYYRFGENKRARLYLFLMPIGGLIAGWTNENSAVALVFFLVAILVLLKIEKRKIPLWAILALVGAIIGAVFLIKAPGNINRFLSYNRPLSDLDLTDRHVLYERVYYLTYHFTHSSVLFLSSAYTVTLLLFYFIKSSLEAKKKKYIIICSLLFFATAYVSFVVLVASPIIVERSLFPTNSLLIIAITILYANFDYTQKWYQLVNVVIVAALLFLSIQEYRTKYTILKRVSLDWEKREQQLNEQVAEGVEDIVLTVQIDAPHEYCISQELAFTDDPNYWSNRRYARFKNVKTVRLLLPKEK